jgi:hypothetical protein
MSLKKDSSGNDRRPSFFARPQTKVEDTFVKVATLENETGEGAEDDGVQVWSKDGQGIHRVAGKLVDNIQRERGSSLRRQTVTDVN